MIRDCARFDAWLDGGRDGTLAASAREHADGCARCAGALELEALLAGPPLARADAAFTEGVLFRVRATGRARAAARLIRVDAGSPWWLRAPAEPSAALAFVVAALLAWRGDDLWSFALSLAARARAMDWTHAPGSGLLDAFGNMFPVLAPGVISPAAQLAVWMPLVVVASWALYRAVDGLVSGTGTRSAGAWLHAPSGPAHVRV